MTASQDNAQSAQAAKQSQMDTPLYTSMPAAPTNQNPNLTQAPSEPSVQTDSMDPNTTPINP